MGGIFFPQNKTKKSPQKTNQTNKQAKKWKKKKFQHFLVVNMQLKIAMLTVVKKPAGF